MISLMNERNPFHICGLGMKYSWDPIFGCSESAPVSCAFRPYKCQLETESRTGRYCSIISSVAGTETFYPRGQTLP
jgi:hypothetical protein